MSFIFELGAPKGCFAMTIMKGQIISITDWNNYFSSTKEKPENELVELRKEIEV